MTATRVDADELLRAAQVNGYRFPAGFTGFRAGLVLPDGSSGQVTARSPREIEVTAAAGAAEVGWVRGEIASIVGHRWPATYEDGDGRWEKRVEDDGHPLGPLIVLTGDPYHSSYRVQDGHISVIDRTMARARFLIVIDSRVTLPDGRALPAHFHVAFWSVPEGRLERVETFQHRYTEVAGVQLPALVRVDTVDDAGLTVRQFTVTDHEVLADA
ncbi:MAG TPA: DUF3386 family protein [Mycobacteriales bacterium]|nr:DUF3386 family protein [Mycobacteriales bacterium]